MLREEFGSSRAKDDENLSKSNSANPMVEIHHSNDDPQDFLGSGRFYGDETFHPQLIITQIIVLQSAYYVCLSGLILLVFGGLGYPRHLKVLFSSESFSPHQSSGVVLDILVLIVTVPIAFCVAWAVERTKKCLDFSSTIHINHFVLCWIIDGFPSVWSFWITHILAVAITTLIAESLCMRTEMQEIIINKKSSGTSFKNNVTVVNEFATASATAAASSCLTKPRQESSIRAPENSMLIGGGATTMGASVVSASVGSSNSVIPSSASSDNVIITELSIMHKPKPLTVGKPLKLSVPPVPSIERNISVPYSSSPLMSSNVFLPFPANS